MNTRVKRKNQSPLINIMLCFAVMLLVNIFGMIAVTSMIHNDIMKIGNAKYATSIIQCLSAVLGIVLAGNREGERLFLKIILPSFGVYMLLCALINVSLYDADFSGVLRCLIVTAVGSSLGGIIVMRGRKKVKGKRRHR